MNGYYAIYCLLEANCLLGGLLYVARFTSVDSESYYGTPPPLVTLQ